ncbi:hypothetical protein [Scatolibacter rhodanostii]|uniref:hypothetical protein n=1 Tax=Scatolibacter rhodanostii TaxID=2014781 RepID=UPI000C06F1F9|nr:hypothetical protein [Scatolibacter rhodanostii]
MFPYFLGGALNNSSLTPLVPFAFADSDFFNNRGMSDEVRAAIEERKDEIHSEEDLHRIAHEVTQKR